MSHKGNDATILVDEFNFDANTSQIQVDITLGEADGTNLASTALEFEPLLGTMKITQNGYFNGVEAAGFEKELHDRLGVSGVLVSALFGVSVDGAPAYIIPDSFNAQMDIAAPVAGLMTLNGVWGNTGQPKRGIVVFNDVVSAIGDEAAVDLGVAGANGGLFVLHVTAITGAATDASVKLQSAATEGGVYADEATITFSAVGGYTAVVSGAVNRWVRLSTTSKGGATSFAVTAIAVVDGVTM